MIDGLVDLLIETIHHIGARQRIAASRYPQHSA